MFGYLYFREMKIDEIGGPGIFFTLFLTVSLLLFILIDVFNLYVQTAKAISTKRAPRSSADFKNVKKTNIKKGKKLKYKKKYNKGNNKNPINLLLRGLR